MSKKFNIKEWQKKHLLKEHTLGQLPSEKLMKMKWNPVTNRTLKEQDAPVAVESPAENDLISDLQNALVKWDDKEHPYYTDIKAILDKYVGA